MKYNEGVCASVKHANLFNKDEENLLWQQGVLGDDTPERLLHAVFYYNGKNICLRGEKEYRCLKISQFVRSHDADMYTSAKIKTVLEVSISVVLRTSLYF